MQLGREAKNGPRTLEGESPLSWIEDGAGRGEQPAGSGPARPEGEAQARGQVGARVAAGAVRVNGQLQSREGAGPVCPVLALQDVGGAGACG